MLIGMAEAQTVLYVEDEISLHALIEFWLTDAGYQVFFAVDGEEGLEMVRRLRPDLVITDAMMPKVTGDELVEIMKSDPELAHIPIVMATAAASPFRIKKMIERGCSAVLSKPLDEQSFLAAAAAALAG
jgi:CheY-like chemotaxis protein